MPREIAERRDAIPALGEVFREYGFSGSSLAEITQRTGLGKGSLYHFFPNGKKEMAEAVLDDVTGWFEQNVFSPLLDSQNPWHGIRNMFDAVDRYFHSGNRICLLGAFALDDTRDRFETRIDTYFRVWIAALTVALERAGFNEKDAEETAVEIVAGIQGALVLARSHQDPQLFTRTLRRLQHRILTGPKQRIKAVAGLLGRSEE